MTALSLGGLAFRSWRLPALLPEFPNYERLGRVAVGMVELKTRPDPDSQTLGVLYEDAVVPWLREVSGEAPAYIFNNQRWVETPKGFIYGPYLQPVFNRPNQAVESLPPSSRGAGMWVEVTVPYAEAALDKGAPSSHSWAEAKLEQGLPLRVYYGQSFWADQIKQADGGVLYRLNPNYYGGVDMLWVAAEALRPITADDLEPISPDAEDKKVVIDLAHQTLSCFEGEREAYFCRVSTGAKFDMYGNPVDKWATPVGKHRVTRKYVSLQMSGGTTGAGYDLPGISWTTIFAVGGVAIHSTFWHNNYGDPMSHGCVNCLPEDAKWVFRWTAPEVAYDPGMVDVTVSGEASTQVVVVEG
ncbi:MAG: L,D-transpeptidase [Anaerolineales bacterium]|nr:L,D-transpeptidase [Anaerolineales bacterium]